MPARQQGTVAKWLNSRGIGFITPQGCESEIGKDIIVHYSNVKQGGNGFKSLAEGSTVEFETTEDPKNPDKLMAINVTGIGGADCEKQRRLKSLFEQRSNAPHATSSSNGQQQVLVSNLHRETSWQKLKDLFRKCGRVERADIKNGSGIVRFSNSQDAKSAIERYDGFELDGKVIKVKIDEETN
jgi:cold shock CspA family protein